MHRELLIAAGPGEWRAALLEQGVAVELYVERGERAGLGSIHLGRVVSRVPALGAVLVEIGDQRPGFLPLAGIPPEIGRLDDGARVLVQVRREAQGGKAARLSTAIRLRGAWLELSSGGTRRAGAAVELGPELQAAAGEDAVAFARLEAPAEPPSGAAIAADATALLQRWRRLRLQSREARPPSRLDPLPGFAAALSARLPLMPERVVADDLSIAQELRAAFPEAAVECRAELDDLDAVFDAALSTSVPLETGGLLHLQEARIGSVVDVDSGTPESGSPERAGRAANLAAARAIARQIRLRNLAGGIVVDFVGIEGRGERDRLRAALADALVPDPARPQLLGWTRLGHLELVRPRRGRSLADALLEADAAPAKTAATLAYEALRAVLRASRARPAPGWRLIVGPGLESALRGAAASGLRGLEERLGRPLAIAVEPGRPRDRFEILPA